MVAILVARKVRPSTGNHHSDHAHDRPDQQNNKEASVMSKL
jgi:hypothetical protein